MFDKVSKLSAQLSALTLFILVFLVVYDATSRYLFHTGSIALQELEWHLFDVVILLGIAYTLSEDRHVRVDIFYDQFSDKVRAIINIVSVVLFIFPISVLIIYVGFDFVALSYVQLESSSNPGGLEYRFIVKSLMPLSFVFLLLQSLSALMRHIKEFR